RWLLRHPPVARRCVASRNGCHARTSSLAPGSGRRSRAWYSMRGRIGTAAWARLDVGQGHDARVTADRRSQCEWECIFHPPSSILGPSRRSSARSARLRLPSPTRRSGDQPAAEDALAVVEDHRLAGGDRPLRTLELHARATAVERGDDRGRGGGAIADLDIAAEGSGGRAFDPVHVLGGKSAREEILLRADGYHVARGVDRRDEALFPRRHADAATLADREPGDAVVPREHVARAIAHLAWRLRQPSRDERAVVAVRHEADIGAVRLLRQLQAHL